MTTFFWITEYVKVFLCYIFIMFIWPSVVFAGFLRGKSLTYRFAFCSTVQIVIINTSVLMLGLAHILNPWTVNILFYGVMIFSLRRYYLPTEERIRDVKRLVAGSLKLRQLFLVKRNNLIDSLKEAFKKYIRPHLIEYTALAALTLYGVIYFSYSPIVDHSYGFGDMYTHHSWIYGLIQGQIFSAGVYPEGMHCVVYMMHTVTGFPVFYCNLFIGCIHTFVYILAAYCFMKEIFRWRGTPLIVLAVFLIVAAKSSDLVISMARLQRSLPGEYGLHTVFLCPLYLLKFLKEDIPKDYWKHPLRWFKNENLIVFSMALCASIAVHFYVTIIAFFFCLPVALVFLIRTMRLRRFLPLGTAVVVGVMLALIPMGGALLSGIPFQGSMRWAMSVINGTEEEFMNGGANAVETEEESPGEQPAEDGAQALPGEESAETAPGAESPGGEISTPEEVPDAGPSVSERLGGIVDALKQKWRVLLYDRGFTHLIDSRRIGSTMMNLLWQISLFAAVWHIVMTIIPPFRKAACIFDNYIPIAGAALIVIIFYSATGLGIPQLIAYIRLPSTAYILMLMVAAMPLDILFSIPRRFLPDKLMQTVSVAGVAAVCLFTAMTDEYHGFFYNELTRYRAAVNVTSSIISSFPKYSYTVVSTTDELYSVNQYGRHEEILTFLKNAQLKQGYYLPTEYVFIYVEKHPIQHAQYHFSSGPRWLGTDVYADTIDLGLKSSKYPEIFASEISEEDARKSVLGYPVNYESYRTLSIRTIINSKAYKWCNDFAKLYENEMKVYYEDDDFICYCFRQNINSLYDLAIWS